MGWNNCSANLVEFAKSKTRSVVYCLFLKQKVFPVFISFINIDAEGKTISNEPIQGAISDAGLFLNWVTLTAVRPFIPFSTSKVTVFPSLMGSKRLFT